MTVPLTVGVTCDACVQHGILISKVQPLFHAATVLKPFDVLTAISGVPIADDGTIQFRNSMLSLGATAHSVSHTVYVRTSRCAVVSDQRIAFRHVISMFYKGEECKLTIIREGKVGTHTMIMPPWPSYHLKLIRLLLYTLCRS